MAEEKNIIDELLKSGFSKREIDAVLHKFIMEELKHKKAQQNVFKHIQTSIRKTKEKWISIIQLSKNNNH